MISFHQVLSVLNPRLAATRVVALPLAADGPTSDLKARRQGEIQISLEPLNDSQKKTKNYSTKHKRTNKQKQNRTETKQTRQNKNIIKTKTKQTGLFVWCLFEKGMDWRKDRSIEVGSEMSDLSGESKQKGMLRAGSKYKHSHTHRHSLHQ